MAAEAITILRENIERFCFIWKHQRAVEMNMSFALALELSKYGERLNKVLHVFLLRP
jgi:hypothetical protein